MSVGTTTHIGCLVVNSVCGDISSSFQKEVERHLTHCGVEWTCNRYKAIWSLALNLRNGDLEAARQICRDNSIAYHKNTCIPKGTVGVVVRRFLDAKRPSVIRRYAAVLRYYTSFKLEGVNKPSPKQTKKIIENISGAPSVKSWDAHRDLSLTMMSVTRSLTSKVPQKWLQEKFSEDELHAEHLKSTSYYYSALKLPKEFKDMPYAKMALSLNSTEWVPESLDYQTPCQEMREVIRSQNYLDKYAGRIFVIQEQGCKARVVAQPTAWLQLAFMPLHKRLDRITKHMFPTQSCVHDQEKGVYDALSLLAKGHDVFSVDLSSATDRFPVVIQNLILKNLGYSRYSEALSQVVKRPFQASFIPEGELKYRCGQPMGLYGSFPLFNLTNLILAETSERQVMERIPKRELITFPDGHTYRVLGDDIIISDPNVKDQYSTNLDIFGVKTSPSKCLSGQVVEFAGFVVVPTTKSYTAFRPYKIPSGKTVTNPLEFLHSIGSKVKTIRSKWWYRQWEAYERTMSQRSLTLAPLVSEDDGPMVSSFRADNHYLISLSQQLALSEVGPQLPDLSGDTKINRSPLFRERGPFDFYGYNPEKLVVEEETMKSLPFLITSKRLSQDPLIAEYRRREQLLHQGLQPQTLPSKKVRR